MRRYVGIDTKRVVRKGIKLADGQTKDFNALLGVGVSVNDLDSFVKGYEKTMQGLFDKIGQKPRRPVYKAKDLNQIFYPTGINPLEEFLKGIADYTDALDIYYSFFLKKDDEHGIETPYIEIYYAEPIKRQRVTAIAFLDLIEESYPAYCAWEHIQNLPKIDSKVFVDNFKIRQCHAWQELYSHESLHITPWGDRCNHLISAADILTSAIDERLRKNNVPFKFAYKVLPEFTSKVVINPSKSCMYMLSPAKDEFALLGGKITRPITYIFKFDPMIFKRLYPSTDQKDFIIDSAIGDRLIVEAAKNLSAIKFYEPTDNHRIMPDDKFLFFDEYGKKQIDFLRSVGFRENEEVDANKL